MLRDGSCEAIGNQTIYLNAHNSFVLLWNILEKRLFFKNIMPYTVAVQQKLTNER